MLRDLSGKPHPLRRKIIAPSETRIRTLLHLISTELLDQVTGSWLRDLADAGKAGRAAERDRDRRQMAPRRPGRADQAFRRHAPRGESDHRQHRIPDETTETTEVKALLEHVSLDGAVVTADAVNAQRDTADYIAGPAEDGGRGSAYFLFIKRNHPKLQRAVFDAIQAGCLRDPDHTELDYGHGRIIKRSIWAADAGGIDFPHVRQIARIRRDGYDADGALISKEVVHAATSLGTGRASAAGLAKLARGQWGIESVHWLRDTAYG